jgi:hypothetical protein
MKPLPALLSVVPSCYRPYSSGPRVEGLALRSPRSWPRSTVHFGKSNSLQVLFLVGAKDDEKKEALGQIKSPVDLDVQPQLFALEANSSNFHIDYQTCRMDPAWIGFPLGKDS